MEISDLNPLVFSASMTRFVTKKIRPHPPRPAVRRLHPPRPVPKRSGGLGKAALLFLVASVILSYPLNLSPRDQGPFDEADARENAWVLSWVSHQLLTDPLSLFDAHPYYPLRNTLCLSEHLLVQSLLASPFLYLTDDLVLTYNVTLIICAALSALGMYILVVSLTGNHLAGLLAGMLYAFVPYRFTHLQHLELQLYAFLPLALASLHLFLESDNRRWAWCYAGCILAQCLCGSPWTAVTLIAVAATMVVVLPASVRSLGPIYILTAAVALALTLLYPFLRPSFEIRQAGLSAPLRAATEVTSAEPASYIASSSLLYGALSDQWLDSHRPKEALFPGLTLVVLGTFGWVLLICGKTSTNRPISLALCYGLLLGCGIVVSLGPHTPLYPWLFDTIPVVREIRNVTPFSVLMLLSSATLSGFALAWLFEESGSTRKKGIACAIAGFFILESMVVTSKIAPFRDRPREVYLWLAEKAVPGAIVELPYRARNDGQLFYARHHGFRPMLNGASRSIPPSHHLIEALFEGFPSEESIQLLEHLDVRYVVVHMDAYPPRELVRLLNRLALNRSRLLPIRDFGNDLVYEVVSRASIPLTSFDSEMVLDSVPPRDLEGSNLETHIEIQWVKTSTVSGLRIHYGPHPQNPATHIEISIPDRQKEWRRVWTSPPEWPARAQLVLTLIEDPRDGVQSVSFEPTETRHFQIRLRGLESKPQFTELELLGFSDPN